MRPSKPYSDPYVAGIGLGLVLLAAFVLVGRGLGASGAFGLKPDPWLFLEIVGVFIGGALSAFFAGRLRVGVERGARITDRTRLFTAFGGGLLMGIGAKLARGCTSGLGLTGGSLLSVGSWLFIMAAFAAAYAAAPFLRKLWT